MNLVIATDPKFEMGILGITRGVEEWLLAAPIENAVRLSEALMRHVHGDWGDVDAEDKAANNNALRIGERLFSAYLVGGITKVWIITERDRSVTTILMPHEY